MNKIYKAFDTIKLDSNIKNKAYHAINEKSSKKVWLKTRSLVYGTLSLAFTLTFIFLVTNHNDSIDNYPVIDDGVDTLYTTEGIRNEFLYNGHTYSLVLDYDISKVKVKEQIGVLKQINSDTLVNDFDSYSYNGYIVYNTSDDTILIVKSDVDSLVYKRY